ncbi:hypothetical protein GCM10018987_06320 [Streptomyces cremeus]
MPAPVAEPRSAEGPAEPAGSSNPGKLPASRRRPRLLAGAAALLVAVAAAYGVYTLTSPNTSAKPPAPTAAVTYSVTGTGTVDITYLATSEQGAATTEKAVHLPWKKTVQVPLGQEPSVKVQLSRQGGEATCALAVRGEHKQRATATGTYGRTTCTTSLPAQEA